MGTICGFVSVMGKNCLGKGEIETVICHIRARIAPIHVITLRTLRSERMMCLVAVEGKRIRKCENRLRKCKMPAEIMQFLFDLTLAHSKAWLQAKPSTRINGSLRTSSFIANEFLLFVGTKSIEHIANVHALIESGEKDPPKNNICVDPCEAHCRRYVIAALFKSSTHHAEATVFRMELFF